MNYYVRNGRTCSEAIRIVTENLSGEHAFIVGNIVKYIWRAGLKPGSSFDEDVRKAANYAFKLCSDKWIKE